MRDILFRGKRKDNGEWVYGNLITDGEDVFVLVKENLLKGLDVGGWIDGAQSYDVIPETVGQYTGLTDKNGTKIFEGDILRLWGDGYDWNGIVVFGRTTSDEDNLEDYGYGWQLDQITKDEPVYTKILLWVEADGIDCEIIGNIHDNPELLKSIKEV